MLAISGMASAFAVLFGAPLGSAISALEILHRRGLEYYEALLPALGGAFVGFAVFTGLEGVGVRTTHHPPVSRRHLQRRPGLGCARCGCRGWAGGRIHLLMGACMVATNVGVTKTPVGSTLVIAKMAGLQLLPSTTLAAIGSMRLTSNIGLISSQRHREPSIART